VTICRMTRCHLLIVAFALALLGLLSVSVERGRTLQILNFDGRPVEDIFVIYHHEGSRPNLVHPISYEASSRSIARGNSAGTVNVHWPLPVESHIRD
jgi:hypothetical protein